MARRRRPGRGCRRRRPARAGRGRLARRLGPAPVFRGLGVARMARPPGLRCTARRGDGAQLRRGPRRGGAGELGRGRGGRPRRGGPRRVARRRLGAVPGIGGRAPLRVRWPRGLGCGRPQARAKPGERGRGGRAASGASRGVFRRLGGVRSDRSERLQERSEGPSGPNFRPFPIAFARPFRIMSDKATLSDIATPRQAGRITRQIGDKAPPTNSPCPGDSRRPRPARRPRRRPRRGRSRAASRSAREPSGPRRKPRNGKPFRRRRRSRPGRGRAEGQGRAIRCSPPAPASLCSTPSCAATRLPPGRCAPASRFRAPRPPPRSCASTPTKARCATCASPSATTLGPAAKLLSLWRDLAGRPPSLDPGRIVDAAARLDLALPTRTASQQA